MKTVEVEKFFKAKGTDKYFKTGAEAAEYAKTIFAEDTKKQIKFAYDVMEKAATQIEQIQKMILEAKSKTIDMNKVWETIDACEFPKLHSKSCQLTLKLPFYIDMTSKENLDFLRNFVIVYGKKEIKEREKTIRHYKEELKNLNRIYSKVSA